MAGTWSTDGRELQPSEDGRSLILPGTNTLFVMPGTTMKAISWAV